MEEEVPIGSFGKRDLKSKKNQDRLDKYCCYRTEYSKKFKGPVRRAIPPFSKKHKAKFKCVKPPLTKKKAYSVIKYFPGDYYDTWGKREVLYHDIGTVNFHYQEIFQNKRVPKIKSDLEPTDVAYFYKPIPEARFVPAPTGLYEPKEIANFQKANTERERRARNTRVFEYLRDNDIWDPVQLSTLTTNPVPTDTSGYVAFAVTARTEVLPRGVKPSISDYAKSDWVHQCLEDRFVD
jgi:hypothetical protein